MTPESFYREMTTMLHREPFQPFVVEFLDGQRIVIDQPKSVAIRGGVAGHIARGGRPVPIDCEDVKQIVDVSISTYTP